MKRLLPLLLILLLLCGCSVNPNATTETASPTEVASNEPGGFYAPDSDLERATQGAVQVYPLNRSDSYGLLPMGEDLLLFSAVDCTTLTKLSGADLHVTATAELDCFIHPGDASVQVSDKGVTYYDDFQRDLVFLDTNLKEVSRVSLPEEILGSPVLSSDRKNLYYCTSDALRVLDLETGLHKLLKEMYFEFQSVTRLHRNDSIIECSTSDSVGNWNCLFLSARTGEMVWETPDGLVLTTNGDSYFAVHPDGSYRELLVGTVGQEPLALYYDDIDADFMPLLAHNGVVLISDATAEGGYALHYYDLKTGKRTASLDLPGSSYPMNIHMDSNGESLWFLSYDPFYDCNAVYRWFPAQTPSGDENVYLSPRRSYENPDLDGLDACREKADEISIRHGVNIRIWTDAVAVQPWDYELYAEYQVPVIMESLQKLDQILARYPEGFLKEAAHGTASGSLRICLVRSMAGNSSDSLGSVTGLQFWDDREDAYICLAADHSLEQNLYHEMFHIIDSRVLSTCSAYDNWSDLNPEGFEYDYNYLTNLNRQDYELIEGSTQAFIDFYSMSFPKEDRARIMEYAMMAGNSGHFTSGTMQAKLHQLCVGIRQAFDWEKSEIIFPWEQYLTESLAAMDE